MYPGTACWPYACLPVRSVQHSVCGRWLDSQVGQPQPAHVQAQLIYVEPRFRVGVQAMVGLDSVIARSPQGVRLNGSDKDQGLGRATVLPAHVPDRLQVGRTRVSGPAGLA